MRAKGACKAKDRLLNPKKTHFFVVISIDDNSHFGNILRNVIQREF